jgi:hypothetical protein
MSALCLNNNDAAGEHMAAMNDSYDDRLVALIACRLLPGLQEVWDDGTSQSLQLDGGAYLQWAKWPEGIQIECISNQFLPEERQLTFAQRRRIAELGFESPSGPWPNYYRRFERREDLPCAAKVLAHVAVEVFGCRA